MRAALLALALALSGCGPELGTRIAGADLDEGGFGNPTLGNRLAMTGHLDARFARAVPTTVTFAFNSAALSPEARAVLDRQAAFMRQFPELRFSVYGHTDLVGGPGYNERLGRARARSVVAYLAQSGVSSDRLRALVSYGETRPLVPTEAAERLNRRAVTSVEGFVRSHPTVLDGRYAEVIYREYVESAVPPPSTSALAGAAYGAASSDN